MIVRVWRGRVAAKNERAYIEHLTRRVFLAFRTIDGFLGGSILKEQGADSVEFLVVTRWASMEAIRKFAGGGRDEGGGRASGGGDSSEL